MPEGGGHELGVIRASGALPDVDVAHRPAEVFADQVEDDEPCGVGIGGVVGGDGHLLEESDGGVAPGQFGGPHPDRLVDACVGLLKALGHRVEGGAQRSHLITPGDLDPPAKVTGGERICGRGHRPEIAGEAAVDEQGHGDDGDKHGALDRQSLPLPLQVSRPAGAEHDVFLVKEVAPQAGIGLDRGSHLVGIVGRGGARRIDVDDVGASGLDHALDGLDRVPEGAGQVRFQGCVAVEAAGLDESPLQAGDQAGGEFIDDADLPGDSPSGAHGQRAGPEEPFDAVTQAVEAVDQLRFPQQQGVHDVVGVEVGVEDELRGIAGVGDEGPDPADELVVGCLARLQGRVSAGDGPPLGDQGGGQGLVPTPGPEAL